jgi:hypothetical protein
VAYRWQYTPAAEFADPELANPEFADQAQAEEWLEAHWPELLDAGVDEVTLLDHDGAQVYGPMSLHPAEE